MLFLPESLMIKSHARHCHTNEGTDAMPYRITTDCLISNALLAVDGIAEDDGISKGDICRFRILLGTSLPAPSPGGWAGETEVRQIVISDPYPANKFVLVGGRYVPTDGATASQRVREENRSLDGTLLSAMSVARDAFREKMLRECRQARADDGEPPSHETTEERLGTSDAYDDAVSALESGVAESARGLAESPFDEFKARMRGLGFLALPDDDPDGLEDVPQDILSLAHPRETLTLANVALCLRYPFLSGEPRSFLELDDESDDGAYAFESTKLDGLPLGWKARFGLEMCEDVRSILMSSQQARDPLGRYHLWSAGGGGRLWDATGTPDDVSDDEVRAVALYERIAQATCA